MNNSWDYADLSKDAKAAGGPQAYTDTIYEAGRQEGHKDMVPLAGLCLVIGAGVASFAPKIVAGFKHCKAWLSERFGHDKITDAELENAKQQLIQGIEDYDAANSIQEEN